MKSRFMKTTSVLAFVAALSLSAQAGEKAEFSKENAVEVIKTLSADDMQGRGTGTEGNAKARAYLMDKLKAMKLEPLDGTYEYPFDFTVKRRNGDELSLSAVNLLFRIKGSDSGGKSIVISAHYDHVGVRGGEIFNGADDNASGVAGLLAAAEHFQKHPPKHDVIFALFDAEEVGLQGARAFVKEIPEAAGDVAFNINFDMLSRSDKNELYAAGAYHTAALKPVIEKVAAAAPVKLLMGHDDPKLGSNDWTLQSDHGPFHREGIPFLYFGVEDHPHYHRPSDDFETVPIDFFMRSIETVVMAAEAIDDDLGQITK
ncbi:M20/M25/M40 family metallo-hydrolase [Kordiimonas laminariae]|uniref:M20/M25/M40 family metallo-hydrolase n=1 Tax=Kordiimonas laminariae TaxID=2917717 RepID=UPI001FF20E46|nr:M20/M25/M40 family metallo-hydrolase [Kordiimonas laminariae]MCK0068569.1 M20/M25/M40 family metallo-hydrolase [Kordiimonas laminariae]